MKNKIKLPKGWELKKLEDGVYEVIQKPVELEVGKDYIHIDGDHLVIDRTEYGKNLGFTNLGDAFRYDLRCTTRWAWREATEEEVKKFFERHLIKRYGEDWKNVKLKKCMDQDDEYANEGLNSVDIDKYRDSWMVWNNNGCLFNGKEWAEVLEEKNIATDLSDIDRPYYISPLGKITCTYSGTLQTKNHMTSRELCEGILALQQLIAFRDNFYDVHGKPEGENMFAFNTEEQKSIFEETHKELFKELKKLY